MHFVPWITIVGCGILYYCFLCSTHIDQKRHYFSVCMQLEARGMTVTPSSLASLPSFSPISSNMQPGEHEIALPEVAKTGLGSSAAMTTAVVAGLLQYLGSVDLPLHGAEKEDVDSDVELIHCVAQAAHCAAQGKIGSGFDVSCAVFGSQRYVRFSPSVLSSAQVLQPNAFFLT